ARVPPSGAMFIQNFARNPVLVNNRLSAASYRTQTLASNLAKSPFFFPDAFPSLKTTWQCTKAFDDDAIPSNGALRSPPSLPRSCCAAGTLQDDVPLWPHVPTLPALSRPPHGRDQSRLAPLVRCRARANASRPSSPHGLPGVEGCAPPPAVCLPQVQRQLGSRTRASAGLGHASVVQTRLVWGPRFGQGQPQGHHGRARARAVAQSARDVTVVDFAQPAAPLARHAHRVSPGFGNGRRSQPQPAIRW